MDPSSCSQTDVVDLITRSFHCSFRKREGLPPPRVTVAAPSATVSKSAASSGSARVYTEGRLQLRLPDHAQPLVFTLKAEQTLIELVNMLFAHPDFAGKATVAKGSVKFSTTFPRKIFSDTEMTKSIKVCPRQLHVLLLRISRDARIVNYPFSFTSTGFRISAVRCFDGHLCLINKRTLGVDSR